MYTNGHLDTILEIASAQIDHKKVVRKILRQYIQTSPHTISYCEILNGVKDGEGQYSRRIFLCYKEHNRWCEIICPVKQYNQYLSVCSPEMKKWIEEFIETVWWCDEDFSGQDHL